MRRLRTSEAAQGGGERCGGGDRCSSRSPMGAGDKGDCGWCRGKAMSECRGPQFIAPELGAQFAATFVAG